MGRRLTAANSATQLTVTRDLDGLVLTRAQTVPNVTVTLQRNDPRGYVTAHQAEHFWEFTRDALGRRQTWSLTPSGLLGWNGIDPAGQPALTWNPPTQAELDTLLAGPPPQSIDDLPPSGRAHEQTWALGLLAGTELRHDGQVVHTRSHTHTPDGRIATLDDNLLGVQAYAYDDVGRLAAADYTLPDLSTMSWTWTYDTAGNRLSETSDAGTATYAYTSGDRLASVTDPAGTTTWTYDSMGRPTAKTEPGPQTTTYTYDASGRLETVTLPDTTLVGYEYDPWGDRIAKHVTAPQAATTSTWYYRDARLFYEYDDQQNLIAATGFAEDGHTPIWRSTPTGDYLYTTDHLGTPILLTDLQGTIVWHARYAPFGQANELVATVDQPWRFPGQYHDPETGLHYNRQRFYDSKTGRYLTPDPIGQTGGLNIYGYSGNAPTALRDVHGLNPGALAFCLSGWGSVICAGAAVAALGTAYFAGKAIGQGIKPISLPRLMFREDCKPKPRPVPRHCPFYKEDRSPTLLVCWYDCRPYTGTFKMLPYDLRKYGPISKPRIRCHAGIELP